MESQKPSLSDRVVGWFSPAAGFRRAQARAALRTIGAYQASTTGRRGTGWRDSAGDPNTDARGELELLRIRSRHAARNMPHGRKIMRKLPTEIVGPGIVGKVKHSNEQRRAAIQAAWDQFANGTAADVRRALTLSGLQWQAARALIESGEVLIRRIADPESPAGFSLQLLEPDYLDNTRDTIYTSQSATVTPGNRIVQGIELDPNGRPVSYRLYTSHPGDARAFTRATVTVPAAEIAHLFDPERVGQVRGVPWLAAALTRLRDYDDYVDAEVLRQKIAACFVAFMTDDRTDVVDGETPITEKMEPGAIEKLPPGVDVKFAEPPGVNGFDEFRVGVLHDIAAAVDIPYAEMTGDLRQVNYSSARVGLIAFSQEIERIRWALFVPMVMDRVWSWFVQFAPLNGMDLTGATIQWTAPKRAMIDPQKENQADRDAVRSGLKALSQAILERGDDPAEVFAAWAKDAKAFDDAGLVFDSDPRKVSAAGLTQARQTQGGGLQLPPTGDDGD